MFRDRTNLFLSYHRTFPRQRTLYRTRSSDAEDPFLKGDNIEQDGFSTAETHLMVDLSLNKSDKLPPKFLDLTDEVDSLLSQNDEYMIELTRLYRKNLLPGFTDKTQDEQQIEDISYKVISNLQRCYATMKRLQYSREVQVFEGKQLQRSELIILDNCFKAFASKIQASSNKFRVMQNNYLRFLNNDDFKPLPPVKNDEENLLLLEEEEKQESQQEMDMYSRKTLQKQREKHGNTRFLEQRDEEITQLAKGVLEVSTIFREMQELIINQGTIIDRIDYNLEHTNITIKQAHGELNQATRYQKRTQKCKVILFLSLLVLLMFFIVVTKPRGAKEQSNNNPPAREAPAHWRLL